MWTMIIQFLRINWDEKKIEYTEKIRLVSAHREHNIILIIIKPLVTWSLLYWVSQKAMAFYNYFAVERVPNEIFIENQ